MFVEALIHHFLAFRDFINVSTALYTRISHKTPPILDTTCEVFGKKYMITPPTAPINKLLNKNVPRQLPTDVCVSACDFSVDVPA
jgi:hypothetical protein